MSLTSPSFGACGGTVPFLLDGTWKLTDSDFNRASLILVRLVVRVKR
jgi:hypothetical protein